MFSLEEEELSDMLGRIARRKKNHLTWELG